MPKTKERNQKRANNFTNKQNKLIDRGTSPIPQKNTRNNNNFDIKRIVLATLASGMTYLAAFLFLTLLTGYIISKNEFYNAQKELSNIIEKESRNQIANIQQSLGKDIIVGLDGAWNHVRQGSCCIVTMIDIISKKIIDYEIVELLKHFVKGNANTYPKNLEAEGIRRLAIRWKNDKRIIGP